MMFMEFWGLCQKYWIPEQNDEWWDEALREMDLFAKNTGQQYLSVSFAWR